MFFCNFVAVDPHNFAKIPPFVTCMIYLFIELQEQYCTWS